VVTVGTVNTFALLALISTGNNIGLLLRTILKKIFFILNQKKTISLYKNSVVIIIQVSNSYLVVFSS